MASSDETKQLVYRTVRRPWVVGCNVGSSSFGANAELIALAPTEMKDENPFRNSADTYGAGVMIADKHTHILLTMHGVHTTPFASDNNLYVYGHHGFYWIAASAS